MDKVGVIPFTLNLPKSFHLSYDFNAQIQQKQSLNIDSGESTGRDQYGRLRHYLCYNHLELMVCSLMLRLNGFTPSDKEKFHIDESQQQRKSVK